MCMCVYVSVCVCVVVSGIAYRDSARPPHLSSVRMHTRFGRSSYRSRRWGTSLRRAFRLPTSCENTGDVSIREEILEKFRGRGTTEVIERASRESKSSNLFEFGRKWNWQPMDKNGGVVFASSR